MYVFVCVLYVCVLKRIKLCYIGPVCMYVHKMFILYNVMC